MPYHLDGGRPWDTGAFKVPDYGSSRIMENLSRTTTFLAGGEPCAAKVLDGATVTREQQDNYFARSLLRRFSPSNLFLKNFS